MAINWNSISWGQGAIIHVVNNEQNQLTDSGLLIASSQTIAPDFNQPAHIRLIIQSSDLFSKIQLLRQTRNPTDRELAQWGAKYISLLESAIADAQSDRASLDGGIVPDLAETSPGDGLLPLLQLQHLVLSLANLQFLEVPPAGLLLRQLLKWLAVHHADPDVWQTNALKASAQIPIETCTEYWNAVFGFVLQGRTNEASDLLQLHPLRGAPAYLTMLQLLGNMPIFYETAHATGRTFEQRWTYWHSEVISCIQKGAFDGDDHLELLASLMSGNTEAFENHYILQLCGNWYHHMLSWLLFTRPLVRLTDLAGFVGRSLKLTHDVEVEAAAAPESPVSLLDRIVLHALQLDSTSFLHSAASAFGHYWLVTHFTDLIYYKDPHLSQQLSHGVDLREYFILEHAFSLFNHPTLWELSIQYLDQAPTLGKEYQQALLSHRDCERDEEMEKVIDLSMARGLDSVVESACAVRCRRLLAGLKQLGSGAAGARGRNGEYARWSAEQQHRAQIALRWAIRSKNAQLIGHLCEWFLESCVEPPAPLRSTATYRQAEHPLLAIDVLDTDLSADILLLSPTLAFLCKYREFHRMRLDGQHIEAANLLFALLASDIVPHRYKGLLLADSLVYLESDEVRFDEHQTSSLLAALDEWSLLSGAVNTVSVPAEQSETLPRQAVALTDAVQLRIRRAAAKCYSRALLASHTSNS